MKAWQFVEVGKPLELVELPDPRPGPGEVLISVRAAGLCHTDVSFQAGEVPGMPSRMPIVLGHEVAGVITEVGPGVSEFRLGERVGIAPTGGHDGPGVGRDGGYAESTIGLVDELVRIPESVSFAQAAAGTDAGSTSYRAVRTAGRVTAGTRVGVIGLGGLGAIGARIAVLLGAEVHAADIRPHLESVATGLGVHSFVPDAAGLAGRDLDVVIDFAGAETTEAAIAAVRVGGRVVQIGTGKPRTSISLVALVTREVELVGMLGAGKDEVIGVYELLATGDLDPMISTIAFDEINAGLDRLRHGAVEGRSVALPAAL